MPLENACSYNVFLPDVLTDMEKKQKLIVINANIIIQRYQVVSFFFDVITNSMILDNAICKSVNPLFYSQYDLIICKGMINFVFY